MAVQRSGGRQRGNIEERGGALRVRLYAGTDPVTGRQVYHRATIPGTDDAAIKKAEDKLAEFRTRVLNQRSAASSVSFSYAIDEWMQTSEIEASTRKTYLGYIANHIKPVLGKIPVKKIDVRTLESFYTELRRCRARCDGRPFVVHKTAEEHDCRDLDCQPHKCKELAASTVQQIHSIISGTLAAAERWDWINSNPARLTHAAGHPSRTRRPRPKRAASSTKRSGWTRTGARSSGSR
jgi:integrase